MGCLRFFDWWLRLIRIILDWIARNSGGGGTIGDDRCCLLARKDKECDWVGTKANYTCPEGSHRQWWYCCDGTQQIACAECTENETTCWVGPYHCSIFWYTGKTC